MDVIRNQEIESGFEGTRRIYLCGNLQKPNAIDHIRTDAYEIGISNYARYTFEQAHLHAFNDEYNFVLEGHIKILLLNEGREYEFGKGDLFVIHPNEPYVGKELPGTRTIFSKFPGGQDKVLVDVSDAVLAWGQSWDSPYVEAQE